MNKSVKKCCICNNEKIGEFITINDKKYHLCCIEQLESNWNELKKWLEEIQQEGQEMRVNSEKLWEYVNDLGTDEKIKFHVYYYDSYMTDILWNGKFFEWESGKLTTEAFFNPLYDFVPIEEEKEIEELTLLGKEIGYGVMSAWLDFTPNDNEQKICSAIESIGLKINELVREVNKLKKEGK